MTTLHAPAAHLPPPLCRAGFLRLELSSEGAPIAGSPFSVSVRGAASTAAAPAGGASTASTAAATNSAATSRAPTQSVPGLSVTTTVSSPVLHANKTAGSTTGGITTARRDWDKARGLLVASSAARLKAFYAMTGPDAPLTACATGFTAAAAVAADRCCGLCR